LVTGIDDCGHHPCEQEYHGLSIDIQEVNQVRKFAAFRLRHGQADATTELDRRVVVYAPTIRVDLNDGTLGVCEKHIPHTTFAREPQINVFRIGFRRLRLRNHLSRLDVLLCG